MKNQIITTLVLQYILGGIFLITTSLWDMSVMFSAVVGCMAGLVPNTYFSIRMVQAAENNNALQWLSYAYRAEIGKWVMTGIIFALAFTSDHDWDPVHLFAGFVLILMSGWIAPFVIKGN